MALSGSFEARPISGSTFGLDCEWSGTQSMSGNYTDITMRVYARYTSLHISARSGTATINGTATSFTSPQIDDNATNPISTYKTLIATVTTRVSHNSDGTKTGVTLKAVWNCNINDYAGQAISSVTAQTSVNLTPIDRSAPSVSAIVTDVTPTAATLTVTSNKTADKWDYKLNSGSWTSFSTASGTSKSTNLSLSPNVSYTVTARARRSDNQVYGTSTAVSVTTPGGGVIIGANDVTINSATPGGLVTLMVYNPAHTHKYSVKIGNTTVISETTISNLVQGVNNIGIRFGTTEVSTIMNAMPNTTSAQLTYIVTTYDSSNNVVGTASQFDGNVYISADAAPAGLAYSYVYDSSSPIVFDVAYTNSTPRKTRLAVQGQTALTVRFTRATAATGATMQKYKVTIGGKTVESASGTSYTVAFGTITDVTGNVPITITATDSRGFTSSVTVTADTTDTNKPALTILPWSPPAWDSWSVERENGVGTTLNASLIVKYSRINNESNTQLNTVTVTWRYHPFYSATWVSGGTLTMSDGTESGTKVFSGALTGTFNDSQAYILEFTVTDATGNTNADVITVQVSKGTPLVAFRDSKVGINKNDPAAALDVDGDVRMNGRNVMGVRASTYGADFDNYVDAGIYLLSTDNMTNVPVASSMGILEVLQAIGTDSAAVQRFTALMGSVYVRAYSATGWGRWSQL